jgi:carboxymethylenebutenolidase
MTLNTILTGMVEFMGNGDTVPGYLARPAAEGPFPGVVVIQEWWGLDHHIKDVVERLAREGFAALAPDLYRGQVAAEPDDARKLAMELEQSKALIDIQSAVNYLIAQPFVQPKQAGVVGFCMGGGLSAMMASQGRQVGAVGVFYGGRGTYNDDTARAVHAPILGIFGEADQSVPLDMIHANESKLREHGKTVEYVIYPAAPHAFFNDERQSYRPEAAQDAWNRTLAWFRRYVAS